MRNYLSQEEGVTLIELLATIILLSIILLSFFTFFTQSAKHTQYNKGKLTAVDIAEEVIADIRDIEKPANLELMGFTKDSKTGEYIDSYQNFEVRIAISKDYVASVLQLARITVKPMSSAPQGASFTTEMYINSGGSS